MSEKDKEYTIDYFEYKANKFNKQYIKALDKVLAIYKRAFELARLDGLEMDDYIVEAKKELEGNLC